MTTAELTQEAIFEMTYDQLVDAVNEADALYYNDPDVAVMPDALYDVLYSRLVDMEKAQTIYVAAGVEQTGPRPDSPTQRPGGASTFAPTRHTAPMLSLDKVTTDEELWKFIAGIGHDITFSVEPKYDGASLSLEFEDGVLVRAVTRGDGTTGDDVTENARLIRGVPQGLTIAGEPFDGWIRGEVLIPLRDFEEVNATRIAAGEKKFANPRNAASGALQHSDSREARRRRLMFHAYDSSDGQAHQTFGFNSMGFTGPGERVPQLVKSMLAERPNLPFETDGVVIKVVDQDARVQLGATGKHPRWAVAYKTVGQLEETDVVAIHWQTGDLGQVTPRLEFVPVQCGGVTVTYATGHNIEWLRDKGVCVGARVEIRRMGDTIPGVERLIDARGAAQVQPPTHCASCSTPLVQQGNSGQVRCPNRGTCPPQIAGRLVRWADRDAADIDGFGPAWIRALVDQGKLLDPPDVYKLTFDDLALCERVDDDGTVRRLGSTVAAKLLDEIEKSKGIGMRRALIGFCIPMASEGTAKRLCKHFDSVEAISESCRIDLGSGGAERLKGIEDIGGVVAGNIQEWFLANGALVSELRALGVNISRLDEDAPVAKTATSKNFVMTGGFEGYKSRKEPAAMLERAGWTSQSGVSDRTHYLISDGDPTSSKAKKAQALGVEVITLARAFELAGIAP